MSKNSSSTISLEDLIAKYGDSSNTTWVEDKFSVWRHQQSGAAQGYAISEGFCIVWGNPLCEHSQYPEVVQAFLDWCKTESYKPLWCCTNGVLEKLLCTELEWRSVWCVQEDGLDPTKANPEGNKEVRKHIRSAQAKGCEIIEEDGEPPEEVKKEIDIVIKEWREGRRGVQVHTTNVEPWRDFEHRRYFYARDAEGKVVGFLFLAKIADGWAIKDSLQINGAPKNLTEWLITSAIHSLASTDEHFLTFGPTPAEKLTPSSNINGTSVKFLSKTYSGIERTFLGNKRAFRDKFEVRGEPIFVCFPPHGLGRHGISALMKVLTD
ncbi:hypothetical protein BD410DRAFT_790274 [Rickenella mellea]|uniref:Phosphatidylglycerol lysyltransferase C-terminal domain-containing protein n=1 Tax=Rickenella mellea TaxID=50990 RepID=A0A4Y7Q0K0_9AGAM|nr:hypothetical protein BD410DRAFT_790274 [Rickenella mellea]